MTLEALIARVSELARTMGDSLQLRGFKGGGTAGQVPTKGTGGDFDWTWEDIEGLPPGGTAGQVLTKDTEVDGEASWQDPASDVADLTTTGLDAGDMLRVATGGGLETRTPAQVLGDIGAAKPRFVQDTTPVGAVEGDEWLNTTNGQTYNYLDGQWVGISAPTAPSWTDVSGKPAAIVSLESNVLNGGTVAGGTISGTTIIDTAADWTYQGTSAATHLTRLGVSSFAQTILDDTSAGAVNSTLGSIRIKSSGQFDSVSNSLADVTTLQSVSLEASTWYRAEILLVVTHNATSGAQSSLVFSSAYDYPKAGSQGNMIGWRTTAQQVDPSIVSTTNLRVYNHIVAATNAIARATVYFKTGSATTVKLQFAHSTTPSGTASLVECIIEYVKINP